MWAVKLYIGPGGGRRGSLQDTPPPDSFEETQKDMEQHLQVHRLLKSDTEKGNRPKLEAISRPVLKEGSSEGAYQFFLYTSGKFLHARSGKN